MYGQGKRKSPRSAARFMDVVHIIIGILVVVLAVIIFLNPEGNQILLPVIFILAAVLNLFNGFYKFRTSGRDTRKKVSAFFQCLLALLLLAVAGVSAVSIWR